LADRASACGRGQGRGVLAESSGDRLRAALGEVRPAELCFDIFTGSWQTTEGGYQFWTAEHALTEGVRPMIPE
jgi:hypothetical protein